MSANYFKPVMTIAGIVPASPEMQWKVPYPDPDAYNTRRGNGYRSVGPTMSIAGIMPGTPQMDAWYARARLPIDQEALFARQIENVKQFGLCAGRRELAAKVVELPKRAHAAQRKAA